MEKQLNYWHQTIKPSHMPKVSVRKQIELPIIELRGKGEIQLRKMEFKKVGLDSLVDRLE